METLISRLTASFGMINAWYAMIVGVLIALIAALLGVTLVLKRFSYIGDGLSHVAFGALTVSAVLQMLFHFQLPDDMIIVLPITVIAAILLLRTGQNTKIKGDAAVAMISVGALAIGYLLMNIFKPKSSNVSGDVCSTLFGSVSILTLELKDVIVCGVLTLIILTVFILFYNKIFSITFDEDFAKATGTNAAAYNLLLSVIIAVIIVMAMDLVGSLLISALVIFPALSAMRVCKSFKSVTVCAGITSVCCAFSGMLLAIVAGTPVGSTIVAVDLVVFIIFTLIGIIKKGAKA